MREDSRNIERERQERERQNKQNKNIYNTTTTTNMASFANNNTTASSTSSANNGSIVNTPYGPGKLISKRPDNVNIIELDWELANNSKAVLFKKAEAEVVETPMGPGILKQRRPDGVDVIELSWELANNSKAIVYKKAKGFRAIDGTTFDNERALRKYMYETFYSFRNQTNNKNLIKKDGEIGGQQMCLEKLDNCEVQLLDVSDSLLVDWVNNSKVFIGPTQESIFIRSCENTTFTICTKQLRTRDCKNCTFYLFCKTEPIVERTTGCTFRAFNGKYKGMKRHMRQANLPRDVNLWWKIFDFSAKDPSVPQPHFRVVRGEPDKLWHIKNK